MAKYNKVCLQKYIHSMIENINIQTIPKKINIIVDGGGFNGAYTAGCLYYFKELETLNITTINYISGTSIGAILGYMYLTDNLHYAPVFYNLILNQVRNNIKLNIGLDIINNLVKEYDLNKINNRLFITYYDISNLKHTVISYFNTREELVDSLIKSSYIPFFIDGKLKYKQNYCDGLLPYLFNKNDIPSIFISLLNIYDIKEMIYTKNDTDIWIKLFKGLQDTNHFFSGKEKKPSIYCSYLDKWSILDFIIFRIREIISLLFIIFLKYSKNIYKLPNIISILSDRFYKNIIYIRFREIFILLIQNIITFNIL
jgi:hypothetical protein